MKIRTRERCPKCNAKFIDIGWTFICQTCLTRPKKYYIEYCWGGKPRKAYKDYSQKLLTGYSQASLELERIKFSIADGNFDIEDYLGKRAAFYRFNLYAVKWLNKYTKFYDSNQIAPTTYSVVKRCVKKYFIPHFGATDIREIKNGDVEDFYLALPPNMTYSFYRGILAYLHKFFVDALSRGDIKQIPHFPKIYGSEEKNITVLSAQIIEKIIENIEPEYQPIFTFLWRHGTRPGEARALHIEDIDLQKKLIIIKRTFSENLCREKTKTKMIRVIPMHPKAIDIINDAIRQRKEGFVFLNRKSKPFPMRTIDKVWKRALKKTRVDPVRLYTLRHSFGTNAILAGAPKELVLNYMGTTVETYLHQTIEGHNKILKFI